MATKLADLKLSRCSNPSRKVRVIGKIREFTNKESGQNSKPWITIQKYQGDDGASQKHRVFLQSTSRKDGYELDYCFGQDEEIHHIYLREIKPLVLEVFNGQNASVIALGAKGSGKTYTIQGTREKPGLAVMAMSEILMKAKELEKSVSISLYELTQDHAYDLLNPEHPAVHVMEDAQGKINLKGLSQVPLNSISEFHNIYFGEESSQNTQKMSMDQIRKHKGLIVHVSSKDDKLKCNQAKKINFVDLAGYEDPKKSSKDGITLAESNRTNKSLYALLNVVSALSANEICVPYRESKLTRILQDSLGGTSYILLLTCLNPSFCQDSLSSINLVSRSCRSTKQVLTDSTNKCKKDSAKFKVVSSSNHGKQLSASLTVKKQLDRSHLLHGKNSSCILKGRKLFEQEKKVNSKQLGSQSEDTSSLKSSILPNLALVVAPFSLEEAPQDKCISEGSPTANAIEGVSSQGLGSKSMSMLQQTLIPNALDATYLTNTDVSSLGDLPQAITNIKSNAKPLMNYEAANTCEVNTLQKKDNASPPLSERIREISNSLKSLCASTPLKIKMQDEVVGRQSHQGGYNDDTMDPKTPILEPNCGSCCSPHSTFGDRSARVKHSLVQEYISFLNSANKEELKSLKGIGEKRATYILELREESPEPFKSLDDLQDIGLSAKQIKGMMKQVVGELFV